MTAHRSTLPEASVVRLRWRDQLRALPRALTSTLARVLRLEPRWYLVVDGRVLGRLVSSEDYALLLQWIGHVHGETFAYGIEQGRRFSAAEHVIIQPAHAGDPRTP